MRYINRDRMTPPALLFDTRVDEARKDLENFIEQTNRKGGTRRPPQSDWLDHDGKFQSEMASLFGHCCAYCETRTRIPPQSVVGRHRPPMLAEDERGNTELLAYCWLIYDWENLLWLCATCARLKGNRFFVQSSRGQPYTPIKDLRQQENELVLDPSYHEPKTHLDFFPNGVVRPRTDEGKATIEVLQLNRTELVRNRRSACDNFARSMVSLHEVRANEGILLLTSRGSSEPSEYGGALTLAVWTFIDSIVGLDVPDIDALANAINNMSGAERTEFGEELLGGVANEGSFENTLRTDSKPPSRIPDVHNLPNAPHPITRVEISNFKALREIAFDLPERVADTEQSPCMLLLGENATGKSSVLEAIALAVIGSDEAAALDAVIDTEDLSPTGLIHRPDPYRWAETAPGMGIQLSFLDSSIPSGLTARAGATRFTGESHCSKIVLAYGPRRYFTTRRTRRFRAPANRVRSLFDPMDMIANPIFWLSSLQGKEWEAAARVLREVLMLSGDDDFERDENPDTPGRIYIRQGEQRVAMKDLSVGYKSVIAMVCDIIREMLYHYDNLEFASGVVFIDEVETHLHPRWKMQIMSLLRRAFPKIQFIATTHDPLCLRGMYDGEVFVLQRSTENQVERVTDLPSIRGMRAEQILTSEFFGLGSTDPETDARLLRYNRLAARIETLSDEEHAELHRLRAALDDGMVLGSTLREQAYVEALRSEVDRQDVAPTKAASPRRADLRATFSTLFEKPS